LKKYGVKNSFPGRETADVGDLVSNHCVNGTMTAAGPIKNHPNEKIEPGDVIVGIQQWKNQFMKIHKTGMVRRATSATMICWNPVMDILSGDRGPLLDKRRDLYGSHKSLIRETERANGSCRKIITESEPYLCAGG